MLDTLRHIVQEVSAAADLDTALSILVARIKQAIHIDACSIYMNIKENGVFVLMATDGLNPDSIKQVRLGRTEGLVGLVGERKEPVNLENARSHPRYRYFHEKKEEEYHAFLGVPIINFREVLGVLVAQQKQKRVFAEQEVDFLVTISAMAAGAISDVLARGHVNALFSNDTRPTGSVHGVQGARGVAMGTLVISESMGRLEAVPDRRSQNPEAEEMAYLDAVEAVKVEMHTNAAHNTGDIPSEVQALFDVYVILLDSETLTASVVNYIQEGNWVQGALRKAIIEHAAAFERMEDPYLRVRAQDIRDIGRRILIHLQTDFPKHRKAYPDNCILAGEEVSIVEIMEVPSEHLAGLVCTQGSVLSHTAILARARGIPAVMGLAELPINQLDGAEVIVDGYQGVVHVHPSDTLKQEYQRLMQEEKELTAELKSIRDFAAETPDGVRVQLYAKIGMSADIVPARESGADGVGLFRTEFAFMARESFPSEEEQFDIYQQVVQSFAPKPVTLRTLDVGGDKMLPYFPIIEENPFLGWRGIRFTLDHPEIFMIQLRAMLRAHAAFGNLRVMFPMVSDLKEVEEAVALLDRAYRELSEEGIRLEKPLVGVMIEVPSAVYLADEIAERVDFLSIGTNDLIQYLLAVDRGNPRVANLYNSFHPAVINAVREVIERAHAVGKSVNVCGEMAGDPAAALLLLGAGIDSLSATVSSIPLIKQVIRNIPQRHAEKLLGRALIINDAQNIQHLLNSALEEIGLAELIRRGQ